SGPLVLLRAGPLIQAGFLFKPVPQARHLHHWPVRPDTQSALRLIACCFSADKSGYIEIGGANDGRHST
ncbi:MAG: hypothetical protein AB8B70_11310, partial [Prochlorococcus sp.]